MATNPKGDFAGKIAFVTGVASGIGRAAALAFAREGASVVAADVSEQDNQRTGRLIEAKSIRPKASTVLLRAAFTSSARVTSHRTARARPPSCA